MSEPTPATSWESLPTFRGPIEGDAQVLIVAATGGSKSTLAATLSLDVASLVAVDEKGRLVLPRSRLVELPSLAAVGTHEYDAALAAALAWRQGGGAVNRVVLRPHYLDVDDYAAHDRIFAALFARGHTVVWVDEITATGSTAQRVPPHLRAITTRGRTAGIGLLTLTQAPYGLVPPIIRRNATYTVYGPMEPDDVAAIHRRGIDAVLSIPPKSGRFVVYRLGDPQPYRLYLPIPPALTHWRAP